jgi:hypothetical protein
MAVPATTVEVQINGILANVAEPVALQTYDLAWISVVYSNSRLPAVLDTDYSITLSVDFNTVTVTPKASLVNKIGAENNGDLIFVKRTLPLTTDITENDVQFREKIAEEFDKAAMKDQQLDHRVTVVEGIVGSVVDLEQAVADAEAAAVSATASAASADISEASALASAATAVQARDEAVVARDAAANIATATGPVTPFKTKALADAGIGGVAANAFIHVFVDESRTNRYTIYQKVSGAYVFVDYLDTDDAYVGYQTEKVTSLRPLTTGLTRDTIGTVSELSDPTLPSNYKKRVLLVGSPPVLAYCDGVKWWNTATGAEITLWWLPQGASLHVDFENDHYYWGGAVKTISDLTVVGAGGYYVDHSAGITTQALVVLDYEADNDGGDPAGTIFSWTSGYPSGNRLEWTDAQNSSYGDGLRVYCSVFTPAAEYQGFNYNSMSQDDAGARYLGNERHRVFMTLKNSTLVRQKSDNGVLRNGIRTVGTLATPTRIGFNCRAWAPTTPDNQPTNQEMKRVTIYSTIPADSHIEVIGQTGVAPPFHTLGDSFYNLYDTMQNIEKLITQGYVGRSQDGLGGTLLSQQAERYRTNGDHFHDSTLIIGDFGMDSTAAQAIEAIKKILGLITHDRWIYLEPAPNTDDGTAARATHDGIVNTIRAFVGEDHFVETLVPAMAESDGSPADLAKVAARRWPTSLTVSEGDFHPNHTLGCPFLGALIHQALVDRGWLPA